MTIAEVAHKTGLSAHTLRFYERAGLFTFPVERSASGRRDYTQDDLDWLSVCTRLRQTGMPLKRIREYAELVRAGRGNEASRLAILEQHRQELRARLAELHENLELIDFKIADYRNRLAQGDAELCDVKAASAKLSAER